MHVYKGKQGIVLKEEVKQIPAGYITTFISFFFLHFRWLVLESPSPETSAITN